MRVEMTVEGVGLSVERSAGCGVTPRCLQRRSEPPTNQAHTSQSSSGLDFQVTVLETFQGVLRTGNVFHHAKTTSRRGPLLAECGVRQSRPYCVRQQRPYFVKQSRPYFVRQLRPYFGLGFHARQSRPYVVK